MSVRRIALDIVLGLAITTCVAGICLILAYWPIVAIAVIWLGILGTFVYVAHIIIEEFGGDRS